MIDFPEKVIPCGRDPLAMRQRGAQNPEKVVGPDDMRLIRNVMNATVRRLAAVVEVNTAAQETLLADRLATFVHLVLSSGP